MDGHVRARSAGILLYRRNGARIEVLLVHPGGPFWSGKDEGAWSIPKGLVEEGEDPLETAKREFKEETGFEVDGGFISLGEVRLASGKIIQAWALEGNIDAEKVTSNKFAMEWPKGSGKTQEFPEVDKAAWFSLEEAAKKIHKGQLELLNRLRKHLQETGDGEKTEEGQQPLDRFF
ncbi:MAG: NUDIX domain-containing protein [Nitrososphaerota archaeon]